MKIRETILRIAIYLTGILCLYAWIGVRTLPVMNSILREKMIPEHWEFTKWGELYYFSYIKHFREKNLPPPEQKYRFSDKHPSIEDADILIFGDSFLDFTRQKTFPERLADSLNKKVYYDRFFYPLEKLTRENFSNGRSKLMIYETVERDIGIRFSEMHTDQIYRDYRGKLRKTFAAGKDWLFYDLEEEMYTKMLKGSIFTTDFYSWIATLKFDLFNFISPMTPKYCLTDTLQPWLFLNKQVNDEISSFYYYHSHEDIETYCNNIADLANKVKTNYNMDFLFIAIPNKYTVYHSLINDDEYNELLPRIYDCLEKKGVAVVRLYDEFMNSDKILFYGTDSHWNKNGVDITLNKTLEMLNKDGELRN